MATAKPKRLAEGARRFSPYARKLEPGPARQVVNGHGREQCIATFLTFIPLFQKRVAPFAACMKSPGSQRMSTEPRRSGAAFDLPVLAVGALVMYRCWRWRAQLSTPRGHDGHHVRQQAQVVMHSRSAARHARRAGTFAVQPDGRSSSLAVATTAPIAILRPPD